MEDTLTNTKKKPGRKSTMTDEERKQKKADYMREYMRKKYRDDTSFREQHKNRCKVYGKEYHEKLVQQSLMLQKIQSQLREL